MGTRGCEWTGGQSLLQQARGQGRTVPGRAGLQPGAVLWGQRVLVAAPSSPTSGCPGSGRADTVWPQPPALALRSWQKQEKQPKQTAGK